MTDVQRPWPRTTLAPTVVVARACHGIKEQSVKVSVDRVEASKAAAFVAVGIVVQDGMATVDPLAPQAVGDSMVAPLGREEMPVGVANEVQLDQDGNKVLVEDEDSEITEQARNLKTLN